MEQYVLFDISSNTLTYVDKQDVMNKLLNNDARVPTEADMLNYHKSKRGTITLKYPEPKKNIQHIKQSISKIDTHIPLYDIYTGNIFIVEPDKVFEYVTWKNYRFPDEILLSKLKQNKNTKSNKINKTDQLIERKKHNIENTISFMKHFNIPLLFKSYVFAFYQYATWGGKMITTCINSSFDPLFKHVKPYYTVNELINIAQIEANEKNNVSKYINLPNVSSLCDIATEKQLSSKILIAHQQHIISNNLAGMIQYYTLQGSYIMNKYLRSLTTYNYKNDYLEKIIHTMWNLILNAPKFDKPYTLYRFVHKDDFICNLKIGGVYKENGFLSTSRNPFCKNDITKFGKILMKINIPHNISGIALCLETLSHFSDEEEIIFPPNTSFKLVARNDDVVYYHTDPQFTSQITTRYEFEWISNENPSITRKDKYEHKEVNINDVFNNVHPCNFSEKVNHFISNFVDPLNQIHITLDDKHFTLFFEKYDSTVAYKDYYAINTTNGYALYTIYNNHILFFIEIGEVDSVTQMHVNYCARYSNVNMQDVISDKTFISFISQLAYFFGVYHVIIYSSYIACDDLSTNVYCTDLYNYLANGTRRYENDNMLNIEIKPLFSFNALDSLKSIDAITILDKYDTDECFNIYNNLKGGTSIVDFYLWLKKNNCKYIDVFTQKINKIMKYDNPFINDVYVLDVMIYLYNNGFISIYPTHGTVDVMPKKRIDYTEMV